LFDADRFDPGPGIRDGKIRIRIRDKLPGFAILGTGIRFGVVSLRGYGCLMRKVKAGGKRP
jgi:hypothetical protein